MKNIRNIIFVAASLLAFSACSKPQTEPTQEEEPFFAVNKRRVEFDYQGGSAEIKYRIDNPVEGMGISISADDSWIRDLDYDDENIYFNAPSYSGEEDRESRIRVKYGTSLKDSIIVIQHANVVIPDITLEVMSINPTSARITVVPKDDSFRYVVFKGEKSEIDQYESDDELVKANMEVMAKAAEIQNTSLNFLLEANSFMGERTLTMTNFEPDKEYYIYSYGVDLDGNRTCPVVKTVYQSPGYTRYTAGFSFTLVDNQPNSLTVNVAPKNGAPNFYSGITTESEYKKHASADAFAAMVVKDLKSIINMYEQLGQKYTWEQLCSQSAHNISYKEAFAGSKLIAYAFAVEQGYITSEVSVEEYTTAQNSVTSNCTFEVSINNISATSAEFSITPSDDTQSYYAAVVPKITAGADYIADQLIVNANIGGINWQKSSAIFEGPTLQPADGLTPETEYTLAVFGVNIKGTRTTEAVIKNFTTTSVSPSELTIDIQIHEVGYNNIRFSAIPSNRKEAYAIGVLKKSVYDQYKNDDELFAYLKNESIGGLSTIQVGDLDSSNMIFLDCNLGSIFPDTEYVMYAFGCVGGFRTTSIFTANAKTLKRVFGNASLEFRYTVYDGDELVKSDPANYPSETYSNRAVIEVSIVPNSSAVGWYAFFEKAKTEEMLRYINEETMIQVIQAYGAKEVDEENGVYVPFTGMGKAKMIYPWGTTMGAFAGIAVDANGQVGKPVYKSLYVTKDMAVPVTETKSAELKTYTLLNMDSVATYELSKTIKQK